MAKQAPPARSLSTTAHAILGVLEIKPRTAYELAMEMRHCFEYFWPRDDGRVYAEAKALSEAGYVRAEQEMIGRRRRTSYRILPKGRRELRRWLALPSQPVSLEFEALVKVYLARFGTIENLAATVQQAEDDAAFMLQVATNVRHVYMEGCAPFQDEYVHVWQFVYDFLSSYFQLLHDWARRTRETVATRDSLDPGADRDAAMRLFRDKVPADWLTPNMAAPAAVPALPGMWRRRSEVEPLRRGVDGVRTKLVPARHDLTDRPANVPHESPASGSPSGYPSPEPPPRPRPRRRSDSRPASG